MTAVVVNANMCYFVLHNCTKLPLYFLTDLTKCQKEYLEATSGPALIGRFIPKCSVGGWYAPIQCHGSTGFCWCVDKRGNELEGSKTRVPLKCPILGGKYANVTNFRDNHIKYLSRL